MLHVAILAIVRLAAAGRLPRPSWGAVVINLDRRPDRLQRFAQAMNATEPWLFRSGRLCRIPGRDGEYWTDHDSDPEHSLTGTGRDPAGISANFSRPIPIRLSDAVGGDWFTAQAAQMLRSTNAVWPDMTAGGAGLYLGHADAWHQVVERGWDYGVVFEDDLTLYSPSFQGEVSRILAGGRRAPWDFLYLQQDEPAWPKNTGCPYGRGVVPKEVPVSGLLTNTGAYVVTQRGAQKLLAGSFPASQQLDAELGKVPDLQRARLLPSVAQMDERVASSSGIDYRDTDVQNGAPTPEFKHLRQAVEGLVAAVADAHGQPAGHAAGSAAAAIRDCAA